MKSSEILEANKDQIRQMLVDNVTMQTIGEHFGVSKHVVRRWAEKLGIERERVKPSGPSDSELLFQRHWPRIEEMLIDGYTYQQIAEDIGVTRGVILGWSKKWSHRYSEPAEPKIAWQLTGS